MSPPMTSRWYMPACRMSTRRLPGLKKLWNNVPWGSAIYGLSRSWIRCAAKCGFTSCCGAWDCRVVESRPGPRLLHIRLIGALVPRLQSCPRRHEAGTNLLDNSRLQILELAQTAYSVSCEEFARTGAFDQNAGIELHVRSRKSFSHLR